MKPGTAGSIVLAALLAWSGLQLTRTLNLLDQVAARVNDHDVRLAVLEARQQP